MAAQALETDLSAMTPLCGHTSEATAYLQPDYPYGARLRCQRRVWVEHHPKRGMRFCAQTTDPRQTETVWNKPKKGTYSNYICLLFNPTNGHVLDYHLQVWTDEKTIAKFQAFWWLFYSRLDAFNQEQLDQVGAEIAQAVNRSKHILPAAASPLTDAPRIEVDVEHLYNSQEGLFEEVYARQIGEGNPLEMPVVSAQAQGVQRGEPLVYNLLDDDQLTDELIQQARTVASWNVTDYSQEHWCRAVLKGYQGFEWNGRPIHDTVQSLNRFKQIKQQVWNAATQYWQSQREQPHSPYAHPVGAPYNITHATCQN